MFFDFPCFYYFKKNAEEVGLEPTNPVRGYSFQDCCNSRYATPPSAERVGFEPTSPITGHRLATCCFKPLSHLSNDFYFILKNPLSQFDTSIYSVSILSLPNGLILCIVYCIVNSKMPSSSNG